MFDPTRLLNPFRNELLRTIQKSNVPVERFRILDDPEGRFVIEVIGTSLRFMVTQQLSPSVGLSSNWKEMQVLKGQHNMLPANHISAAAAYILDFPAFTIANETIGDVCKSLMHWLTKIVEPYLMLSAIPDLWTELEVIRPYIETGAFTESDLEPYSEKEKENLRKGLEEFEKRLEDEFSLLNEDMKFIKERIDYLTEALDRLNRFDWKAVALSAILGIATNIGVDPSTPEKVLSLLQQAISRFGPLLTKGG